MLFASTHSLCPFFSIQKALCAPSFKVKPRDVKVITYVGLHLKLKTSGVITPFPPYAFMVCLCMATLTEVFPCFFPQLQGKCQGKTRKDGARPPLFLIVVLFYVLFVLCCFLNCLCVYAYCTTATGWLSNFS